MSERGGRRRQKPKEETALFSERSERIVVGAALQDQVFFYECQAKIQAYHFATTRLGRIWEALVKAMERGKPPTKSWVPLHITSEDRKEEDPLLFFLNVLMNDALEEGISTAELHADIVFQLANKRAILESLKAAEHAVMTAEVGTSPQEMQNAAITVIGRSIGNEMDKHIKTYDQWAREVHTEVTANYLRGEDSTGLGLTCGLRAVEDVFGRLIPGRVYVLAGMSGAGKSALAGQIVEAAQTQASQDGLGWGYMASLEMTGKEYAMRGLARQMKVKVEEIEMGQLDKARIDQMDAIARRMAKLNIEIDSTPNMTIDDIRSHMLATKFRRGRISLGVIDHLLIVAGAPGESLFDKVSRASMATKNMAKEFGIPIILLAQLTEKKIMETGSKWPNATHLFGGETITQNADAVGFIHRHEIVLRRTEPATDSQNHDKWVKRMDQARGRAHFFTDKRRGGASDVKREMRFVGETMTFEDI